MEQNQDSKTEQPTHKRLQDARKEGNVAKSKDLSTVVSLSVLILELVIMYKYIIFSIHNMYGVVFATISENQYSLERLLSVIIEFFILLFKIIIPIIIVSSLSAGLTTVIQLNGFLFATKVFKFDLQKFDIIKNFKELFSKKNILKFCFNVFKISIMTYVGFNIVSNNIKDILKVVDISFSYIILFMALLILKLGAVLLGIFAVFAFIDFIVEKRATHKKLMMSMEEVKKDYKETEGNPEVKSRRRELHKELLEGDDMFDAYKEFMMVLANPTHIAIVMIYKPTKWKLPIILMKAKGYSAQNIFRIAKRKDVPIIRDKWIARQLYAYAEINKPVPKSMVKFVATLIGNNLYLFPKILEEINKIKKDAVKNIETANFEIKDLNINQ
jgi:flagellar biosynthesis protein FlhB